MELKRLRPEFSNEAADRKVLEQIRPKRYKAGQESSTDDYEIVFKKKRAAVVKGTK